MRVRRVSSARERARASRPTVGCSLGWGAEEDLEWCVVVVVVGQDISG
jgi:hypothetical protein